MTAHRDGDGDWRMRPARPAEGGSEDVRIVKRLASGQTLITPARFISPEELRAEFVEWGHVVRGERLPGNRRARAWVTNEPKGGSA